MLDLKREWAATNRGTGDYTATSLTFAQFQFRPDYANPRAVLDVRVRRALAHAVDKQTLGETIWAGELTMMESVFEPATDYYPAIERAITKYPYDPRTSERLMNEAGYTKGADGFFTGLDGKLPFVLQSGQTRSERPVLAANWRAFGFEVQEQVTAPNTTAEPEARSTFPALSLTSYGAYENQELARYTTAEVASADTRWRGENESGWSNPAYDRLVEAFNTTMDPNERIQQRARMAQILTDDLPAIMLSYNPNAHAYLTSVTGVTRSSLLSTGRVTWNIERWELQ